MGNSASSLPYSIGKQAVATSTDGWARHDGNRKSDNAAVSVFVAKKPALSKAPINKAQSHLTRLAPALHHFSHCKKLRHPHILQVYATLDTDHPTADGSLGSSSSHAPAAAATATSSSSSSKAETGDLIIVTEPCLSLDAWLETSPPLEQIAWGLEAIVRALHFLHNSAGQAHGNLSPESFVVTKAGDVKLWNFSLVTTVNSESGGVSRYFMDYQGMVTPVPYQSPERQQGRWEAIAAAGVHTMDSFGVGVLIPHLFGGQVPPPLQKAVQRLLTPNLKMRPRLQPLLKCPIFDTPYQKLQLQLEEFTVQPVEQKIHFWQNLTPTLQAGLLPSAMAVHKLLPLIKQSIDTVCKSDSMRTQDMYRREVLSAIQPMFFIAEQYLEQDTVNQEIGSTVGALFKINDRAIRGALLQKITFLSQNLDANTLNQAVFEPACSGFSDSSAALRELTLKATLQLVPHLNQPNLEKLSRYLVRLQGDPEASIRTNTVVMLGKLIPHLTEVSRQKLLLPAISRALKDPFVPCRLAALNTVLQSKEYFDAGSLASKVLPVVTPQLLDPSKDVRRQAFVVVDDLLFVLRQESERMNDFPEAAAAPPAAPVSAGAPVPKSAAPSKTVAPAPSSGGYLSGISSWMASSAKPTVDSTKAAAPRTSSAASSPTRNAPQPRMAPPAYTPAAPLPMAATADDDGWDDDEFLDDLSSNRGLSTAATRPAAGNLFAPTNGNEDDLFGNFDAKPAKAVTMKPTGAKLAVMPAKKTAAPAVSKLAMDDDMDDGWDDF